MTLLSDEDFVVRFATGKAIGKVVGNYFHAVAVCVEILKDEDETNRAMGAECLLSIRRYVGDHLDLLTMAMADVSWQARLDIEELLAELRRCLCHCTLRDVTHSSSIQWTLSLLPTSKPLFGLRSTNLMIQVAIHLTTTMASTTCRQKLWQASWMTERRFSGITPTTLAANLNKQVTISG